MNGQQKASPFRIALSIEKDLWAHQTLTLRAFFRQFIFEGKSVPLEYYKHIQIPHKYTREELFNAFELQSDQARKEALLFELGISNSDELRKKIKTSIKGADNWILIGGPPCQAYSLAGRSRNAGNSNYIPLKDKRHFLYKEYLQIIAEHWPTVFVMENVKGILSSKIEGQPIFPRIQDDLIDPGKAVKGRTQKTYSLLAFAAEILPFSDNSTSFIIRSEEYGIPQARHRVIILGVRNDVIEKKGFPHKLQNQKQIPIDSVIDLPKLRSAVSKSNKIPDNFNNWLSMLKSCHNEEWFKQCDSGMQNAVKKALETIEFNGNLEFNSNKKAKRPEKYGNWFYDKNLKIALNHEARGHRDDDLWRYLFAACFAKINGRSPQLKDFPSALIPNHRSATMNGVENAYFSDRFRVQCYGKPSTTITCHLSKDGHYYIHPDPAQCRSLTVREAARIQTFPDNYFFCGPRTEQFKQVGNAVPPLLAKQLAQIVYELLSR